MFSYVFQGWEQHLTKEIPDTEVVVFAYNRPELLARLLRSLRDNAVPRIHAFSDGPRTPADVDAVSQVRDLLRGIDWCQVVITERPTNMGLGRSVRSGVTEILSQYEAAIVFEDDLVCVPGTYRYLTAAMDHYREDSRVMSVTAWTHPWITPRGLQGQPYFDGKGECWAWGAWARSWDGMHLPPLELMKRCQEQGIDPELYGFDMPIMAEEAERRNTWAIGWWYLHLLRGGLCLRPPHSMVEHIGWDSGTTATPTMMGWANPPLRPAPLPPENWPEPVEHSDCVPLWRRAIGEKKEPTQCS